MNDSYAEWLIKRKVPFYAYILNAVLSVITAISVILAFTTGVLAVILMFACAGALYLSYRNTRLEFEYLYVDNQLSVDKILGRAARKKFFECNMEEIQIIAPSDSHVLNEYRGNARIIDASSHQAGVKTYTAVVQKKGEIRKLVFEPSDKMMECFRRSAPRKIMQ